MQGGLSPRRGLRLWASMQDWCCWEKMFTQVWAVQQQWWPWWCWLNTQQIPKYWAFVQLCRCELLVQVKTPHIFIKFKTFHLGAAPSLEKYATLGRVPVLRMTTVVKMMMAMVILMGMVVVTVSAMLMVWFETLDCFRGSTSMQPEVQRHGEKLRSIWRRTNSQASKLC